MSEPHLYDHRGDDPHHECRAEVKRLNADNARLRDAIKTSWKESRAESERLLTEINALKQELAEYKQLEVDDVQG